MKRFLFVAILAGLTAGIAIQFIRPAIPDAPVTAAFVAPKEVDEILKRACYDCHSNQTRLRWFDQIAPAYWRVADHVNRGRAVLNFSEWDKPDPGEQKAKLWESVNQVMLGAMPLSDYQFVHPGAKISPEDLGVLKNYLLGIAPVSTADTAKARLADEQFASWKKGTLHNDSVPVALNGVAFMPDYKNWQPVSTSNRFDNGTMRLILGNDIVVNAIRNNTVHPWPAGAAFAKVSFTARPDSLGNLRPGAFLQVEFMIKDERKYAETGGWGFSRFKTVKMLPYGKSADFDRECIRCHQPMKNQDFVFTQPIKQ